VSVVLKAMSAVTALALVVASSLSIGTATRKPAYSLRKPVVFAKLRSLEPVMAGRVGGLAGAGGRRKRLAFGSGLVYMARWRSRGSARCRDQPGLAATPRRLI